jgi:hypothetical protein
MKGHRRYTPAHANWPVFAGRRAWVGLSLQILCKSRARLGGAGEMKCNEKKRDEMK